MKRNLFIFVLIFLPLTQIFSQTADEYNKSGISKLKHHNYIGAMRDFNKAIELNPKLAEAYYNRGRIKNKLEDYRGAIQDFTEAIEINPKYTDAYYNRGSAKYNIGDKKGACLDLSKAGELGEIKAYDLIKIYCNQ